MPTVHGLAQETHGFSGKGSGPIGPWTIDLWRSAQSPLGEGPGLFDSLIWTCLRPLNNGPWTLYLELPGPVVCSIVYVGVQ